MVGMLTVCAGFLLMYELLYGVIVGENGCCFFLFLKMPKKYTSL